MSDFVVEQGDMDRYARETVFKVVQKKKQVTTPSTGLAVRTRHETSNYVNTKLTYSLPHQGFVVGRLSNAQDTIMRVTQADSNTLLQPSGAVTQLRNHTIALADPSPEYPYYDPEDKLAEIVESRYVPSMTRKLVSEIRVLKKAYRNKDKGEYEKHKADKIFLFWSNVESSASARIALAEQTMDNERIVGGDYGFSATPLINEKWTSTVSHMMNDLSRRMWAGRFPFATYLPFGASALEDRSLIDDNISYLRSIAPSNGDSDVVAFKFKEFDATHPERGQLQRSGVEYLLKEIVKLKKETPRRLFMLLEGGLQLYPCLVAGFDVVTTTVTGHEGDSRFSTTKENRGWSSYWDDKKMIHLKFRRDLEIGKLCLCPACEPVTDLSAVTQEYWNFDVVRPHFAITVNGYGSDIRAFIAETNVQEARRKIELSDLSTLKSLIPAM